MKTPMIELGAGRWINPSQISDLRVEGAYPAMWPIPAQDPSFTIYMSSGEKIQRFYPTIEEAQAKADEIINLINS